MIAAVFARHSAGLGLCRYDGTGPGDALPAFLEDMPPTPTAAVAFYAIPATEPGLSEWVTTTLRIIVRGDKDAAGRNRTPHDAALAFLDAYHGLNHVTLAAGTPDETDVLAVYARHAIPLSLGPDASGQPRWSAVLTAEHLHPSPHREASVL